MTARMLFIGAVASLLAACATTTPYAPASADGFGFRETQIEAARWRVAFSGNSLSDIEDVETKLLFRAAELTLQNGFDWFEIVNRNTEADRQFVGDTLGPRWHGRRYFHPYYGWYAWHDPFWTETRLREITRYEADAEIVMGSGPKPARVTVYDARDVDRNLRGRVYAE